MHTALQQYARLPSRVQLQVQLCANIGICYKVLNQSMSTAAGLQQWSARAFPSTVKAIAVLLVRAQNVVFSETAGNS